MKKKIEDLAIFTQKPEFPKPLPVGQINIPKWEKFEKKFNQIFSNRYYTNQGPLTEELERKLSKFLNVKNAICVNNATLGLIITAKALGIKGKVIVPSFTFIATIQSLSWAGLEPVFCEVDEKTHLISIDHIKKLITNEVKAILGVHLWGNSCHSKELENLAKENNIKLYYDAAHAFGCQDQGTKIGNFGEAEIFSFHATKILNATEGGCIATNDDNLAQKIRNIRSSYGVRKVLKEPLLTGNARMSEAQAAMTLLSLEDYPENQNRNKLSFELYQKELEKTPGIKILEPKNKKEHNYQYIVMEISQKDFGISRDLLIEILTKENIICRKYFSPGSHLSYPYNKAKIDLVITDKICQNIIQFPVGSLISKEDIAKICQIVRTIQSNAKKILNTRSS